ETVFLLVLDKSCLAKIKARRRSNVGARGSPETNSLIRFIAQQRMKKTPPNLKTPEVQPFSLSRHHSARAPPIHYVTHKASWATTKQQLRRKRLLPTPTLTERLYNSCIQLSYWVWWSSGDSVCLSSCFVMWTDDSTGTSVAKKRKQVHFGAPLSPEFFDKKMPPSTPLRKGGTPVRALTPGGCLLLRSVLKTPQRSESNSPQHEPELDNPSEFGASPTFVMPHKRRLSEGKDGEDGKVGSVSVDGLNVKLWENIKSKWYLGVLQMSSLAACLWKKDVDRSLYGSRKYASKKPTLSPIKEKLFLSSQSPALPQSTENCTGSAHSQCLCSSPDESKLLEGNSEIRVLKLFCPHFLQQPQIRSPSPLLRLLMTLEHKRTSKCAEKRQSVSDVAEAGMTERAEGQHGPSQDGQGGGNEILYSWQADFNLEDVFKPIARRGQRSVRRSLRNQRRSDNGSSGLVWLPYTPSDSVGQTGRATRRRLSGIVPVQPPLSEDMQELMVEGDNQ
uniref:Cell division cycle associated 2 n=1 Tax=Nothobranchius furzeri TaxID=105023 RepID=A0A8C6Q3K0_NOTFU